MTDNGEENRNRSWRGWLGKGRANKRRCSVFIDTLRAPFERCKRVDIATIVPLAGNNRRFGSVSLKTEISVSN